MNHGRAWAKKKSLRRFQGRELQCGWLFDCAHNPRFEVKPILKSLRYGTGNLQICPGNRPSAMRRSLTVSAITELSVKSIISMASICFMFALARARENAPARVAIYTGEW
jgi:hypothetical protein